MTIHVHIERLVVDEEITRGDVRGLRRSVPRELARLLRDGGLSDELHASVALPSMRGGDIALPADRATGSAGSRVARAIDGVIGARRQSQQR